MKKHIPILVIILLTALLVYPVGCLATDPLPATLFTRDILPGDDTTHNIPSGTTFDIGSEDLPYGTGYFDNLIVNEQITTERITYSEVYFLDIPVPATAVKLSGVKPPQLTLYKGGLVLEFEDKAAPNEQIIYFDLQIPDGWKQGTEIHVHIHWIPDTDTAGLDRTVGWRLTTSWANLGEDFPTETTSDKTATINNQVDQHIRTPLVTLSDTSKLSSSMVIASLMRLSDTDTFTGSAYLTEIDFHYEVEMPGAAEHMTMD